MERDQEPDQERDQEPAEHDVSPRGILFLCVANSARSQMAEGIARSLVPAGVSVYSAGSEPKSLHPLAVRALEEIGIDIRGARSKHVSEISVEAIDTVITLCAEEVCPVIPGRVRRFHWGLPDPAAAPGGDEDRLAAFRATRDALVERIRNYLQH